MGTNASMTLALVAGLAAATALAQTPQPDPKAAPSTNTSQDVSGSDPGFFRPRADPALTTFPLAPAAEAPRAGNGSASAAGDGAAGVAVPDARAELEQAQLGAARRTEALLWAEEQLDRAEREHEEALERTAEAPPSVGAAFTGSTNPRDR